METDKQNSPVQKYNPTLYKAAKERVHIAEQNNKSYILLFGGGDGWYKMGGNSLLIYKYFVCPRNSTKPRVHPDEDYVKPTFKNGVITIHSIESLTKKIEKAGILKDDAIIKDGIVKIALKNAFTPKQLEGYQNDFDFELEKQYAIIKPNITIYPHLHTAFREILKRMYEVYRHMEEYKRTMFGNSLLGRALSIENTYLSMNKNLFGEKEGWIIIKTAIDNMQVELTTATELDIINLNVSAYIGERLVQSSKEIKEILAKSGSK